MPWHSDIIFAAYTREANITRRSRISLHSNNARRKANITEKSTCNCKCFFHGWDSWTRTSEMQESKSCALTNLAISHRKSHYTTPPKHLSIVFCVFAVFAVFSGAPHQSARFGICCYRRAQGSLKTRFCYGRTIV